MAVRRRSRRWRHLPPIVPALTAMVLASCTGTTYEYVAQYRITGGFVGERGDSFVIETEQIGGYEETTPPNLMEALSIDGYTLFAWNRESRWHPLFGIDTQITRDDGPTVELRIDTSASLGYDEEYPNAGLFTGDLHRTTFFFVDDQLSSVPIRNRFYVYAPVLEADDPILSLQFEDEPPEYRWNLLELNYPNQLNGFAVDSRRTEHVGVRLRLRFVGVEDRKVWFVAPDGSVQQEPIAINNSVVFEPGAMLDLRNLAVDFASTDGSVSDAAR